LEYGKSGTFSFFPPLAAFPLLPGLLTIAIWHRKLLKQLRLGEPAVLCYNSVFDMD
jgi:hypothetical protein